MTGLLGYVVDPLGASKGLEIIAALYSDPPHSATFKQQSILYRRLSIPAPKQHELNHTILERSNCYQIYQLNSIGTNLIARQPLRTYYKCEDSLDKLSLSYNTDSDTRFSDGRSSRPYKESINTVALGKVIFELVILGFLVITMLLIHKWFPYVRGKVLAIVVVLVSVSGLFTMLEKDALASGLNITLYLILLAYSMNRVYSISLALHQR